jgi:hypothetical protein
MTASISVSFSPDIRVAIQRHAQPCVRVALRLRCPALGWLRTSCLLVGRFDMVADPAIRLGRS